jgi:hypothetical protein
VPSGNDPVDEPDALGLGGADLASGEDEVESTAQPDDAGQSVGAAVDQRHAPPAFQAPEPGAFGGDAQVAPCRQLQAAGDAPALDGRDDRLRERQAGRPEGPAVAQAGQVPQVGAGAERRVVAGIAGEHRDLGRVVVVEGDELVVQALGGRGVDGVAHRGLVDVDDAYGVRRRCGHVPMVPHRAGWRAPGR